LGNVLPTQRRSSDWTGPLCGLASAVFYTLANIALRESVGVNPYLVSAVKALPTVVILGPVLGWMLSRGTSLHVSRQRLPAFLAASFGAQFIGNAAFQQALGHIGLAATVPITLGTLIVAGAAFGAALLREPVSQNKVLAMVILISAVVVLSIPRGGQPAGDNTPTSKASPSTASQPAAEIVQQPSSADVLFGSFWATTSGIAYAIFGVILRQILQTGMRPAMTMFISGVVGVVSLWTFTFWRLGSETIAATSTNQWLVMTSAGVFNFSAFVALTGALRRLPVVAVNLINASQVAMAAMAGVALFGEPITVQLIAGILLTLLGLVILTRRTRASVVITD